ncbi:MAG: hypothetical protein IKL22_12530 [Lachnospiraceae bacterium]|nr:hypothetical protein [Lachnospiraceae bacterium]
MIFKCKNCGGNTVYSPEHEGMFCPYCESEKSHERKHDLYNITHCPDCSGELEIGEYTSALQCPYCSNYIILNERVEGEFTPKKMIPFKYSKNMVKQLMRDNFKSRVFAPTDFLSEVRLNSMTGEYVPFWLYDYDARCVYRGEGTKTRSWSSGEMHYTETSYYNIIRDMNVGYSDIPVDASIAMPDHIMDLMEPYNYDYMVDFVPEFMSGFNGQKYNMSVDTLEKRAIEKLRSSADTILRNSINGYSQVVATDRQVTPKRTDGKFCLLPVWKYIYKYKGEEYPFYINGQTGKIIGKAPVSKAKVKAYGFTLWASLTAIILMAGYIVTNF